MIQLNDYSFIVFTRHSYYSKRPSATKVLGCQHTIIHVTRCPSWSMQGTSSMLHWKAFHCPSPRLTPEFAKSSKPLHALQRSFRTPTAQVKTPAQQQALKRPSSRSCLTLTVSRIAVAAIPPSPKLILTMFPTSTSIPSIAISLQ